MALSVKRGRFNLNTSTGNQSVTGLGFQPKLLIFYAQGNGSSATDGGRNDGHFMFGAAASSTQRWVISSYVQYNDPGFTKNNRMRSDRCISLALATDLCDFVSMDADGFTINVSATSGFSREVHYIALGGSDLSNVKVGTFTNTGTGNKSTTGIGFQPDGVIFASHSDTGDTSWGGYDFPIGFGKSSSQRGHSNPSSQSGSANTYVRQLTNSIIGSHWLNANEYTADLVSLDSDGWTLNYAQSGLNYQNGYIAFKGIQISVGSFSEATSTGNNSVTGTGFTPSLLVLMSASKATSSSIGTNGDFSFGVALSSSDRDSISWNDPHGASPNCLGQRYLDTDEMLSHITGTTSSSNPTVNAQIDLVSMDGNGFTYNQSTADATSREVIYLALGATASSSSSSSSSRSSSSSSSSSSSRSSSSSSSSSSSRSSSSSSSSSKSSSSSSSRSSSSSSSSSKSSSSSSSSCRSSSSSSRSSSCSSSSYSHTPIRRELVQKISSTITYKSGKPDEYVGDVDQDLVTLFQDANFGFKPMRLTTSQRNSITNLFEGLIIYNVSTNKLNVYTVGGWEAITSS